MIEHIAQYFSLNTKSLYFAYV